ncbi:hypothetical protein EST38_g3394 [Candolleomyces aberdarensis]|uniref:Uncharacterized protein n=1 Tax=Candolleomyces aberdarensis TaxID=2316362 RepID=A0A4Q2DQN8_9AGAR|nr:hypothetical protein EST38_g3394 [Candolleomyces aberdarensis]
MADDRDVNMEGVFQNAQSLANAATSSSKVIADTSTPASNTRGPAAPSFDLDDPTTALLAQILHRSNTIVADQILRTLPDMIKDAISQVLPLAPGQQVAGTDQKHPIVQPQQQLQIAQPQQATQPPPAVQPMEIDREGPRTPQRKGRAPTEKKKKLLVKKKWDRDLRAYLQGQHVGLCKVKDPSPTADPERVKAYNLHGRDPLTLPDPQFDWADSLKSAWNVRLITMMARGFQQVVRSDPDYETPPNPVPELCTLTYTKNAITERIKKTRTEWRRRSRIQRKDPDGASARLKVEDEEEAKEVRRTGRRRRLYQRRLEKIKDDLAGKDPRYWEAVLKVLEELTEDGMSSDETEADDEEDNNKPKITRRIAKPWLSAEVSELMRTINKAPVSKKAARRGNRALERKPDPRPMTDELDPRSHTMRYMKYLPRNYYSEVWFQSLPDFEQEEIDPSPEKPLPTPSFTGVPVVHG